jgi:predicted lipoprotein with Yx(FWY)xxD motif
VEEKTMTLDRRSHKGGLLAVSGLALALVLAACGGSSTKTSTGSPGATNTTVTTAPSTTASTAAGAASNVSVATNGKLGNILVDAQGMTLYVFDKDVAGKVTCLGGCAQIWHALLLPAGMTTPVAGQGVSATLSVVMRPDGGAPQVALAGRPLYTYAGDTAAGDTNGDGVGGIWHAAKPAGNPMGAATATTTPPTTAASSGGYGY